MEFSEIYVKKKLGLGCEVRILVVRHNNAYLFRYLNERLVVKIFKRITD